MLHILILSCVLAAAAAAPATATFDQRQEGEFNVRADLQNVVLLIALPQKLPVSPDLLDLFLKDSKQDQGLQERADIHVMDAFVEPNTPYRVEIGTPGDRSAEGDGRAVEVVIAGRRSANVDSQDSDELKLLGALEQCGPDRERDPATLTCRDKLPVEEPQPDNELPAVQPEVVSATA